MSASKLPAISSSAFPPEIIEAILRFLPAKPLGRFKCVSKTWNALISNPRFIKNHLHHLQNPTTLILHSKTTNSLHSIDANQLLPYLNDKSNNDDDDIPTTAKALSFQCENVLGSCNGLVLAKDVNDTIFLINPTTQEERWDVPLSPFVPPDGECFAIRYYGLGYDSSTDDYKVVTISIWYSQSEHGYSPLDTYVSVYSLRNNSWKKLPDSPYFVGLGVDLAVVVNRSFHWLQYLSSIVSFSFTTEEFNEFKLQLLDNLYQGQMVQICDMVDISGKLGMFLRIGRVYELWVMEDYGVSSSWTRVCCHEFKDNVKLVCLVEGSGNRDIILDVKGGGVVVFNIDDKRCRNVRIEEGMPGEIFTVGGTYAESLESPKRILRAP